MARSICFRASTGSPIRSRSASVCSKRRAWVSRQAWRSAQAVKDRCGFAMLRNGRFWSRRWNGSRNSSAPEDKSGDRSEDQAMRGFKQFMMRGNVVELAVAVVVGGAFGAGATALVKALLTPLIAAIFGKPDFSAIFFPIHNSRFPVGDFINALVTFLMVGSAV